MHSRTTPLAAGSLLLMGIAAAAPAIIGNEPVPAQPVAQGVTQQIDLAQYLAGGKLRPVNRKVDPQPGTPGAIYVTEKEDNGVIWVEGTDLAEGTIEADIRGRDVQGRSFVGIAFHRHDDGNYEAVYLRPFNFRAQDPMRHQHAVQYIALPEFDWPRLRKEFPEEFESPVDGSNEPTGWVKLRLVLTAKAVRVYVGNVSSPALEVRRLGRHDRGPIGLWTGNGSDGAFANLRISASKD